jgi:integrase
MEERSLDSDPHASEEKPGAAKACAEAANVLDLVSANTLVSSLGPKFIEKLTEKLRQLRSKHPGAHGRMISDETVRNRLAFLRAALKHSEKHKRLTKAPFIQLPPKPPGRDIWLTTDEFNLLLEECREPHLRLYVEIAIETGGRKGAILDLRWDTKQIDYALRTVHLKKPGIPEPQPKKRRASVPMSDRLYETLKLAQAKAKSAYVIEYPRHRGHRVGDIKRSFKSACRRVVKRLQRQMLEARKLHVGDPKRRVLLASAAKFRSAVSPHTLRHTVGSWQAQDGRPLQNVGAFLGQKDPRSTLIYVHHDPGHLRAESDAIAKRRGLPPRVDPPAPETEPAPKPVSPRELAKKLTKITVDDGANGTRLLTRKEIEDRIITTLRVTRNVAQSAATKMTDPNDPARRTRRRPIERQLSQATAQRIRDLSATGKSQREIAELMPCDRKTVRKVLQNRCNFTKPDANAGPRPSSTLQQLATLDFEASCLPSAGSFPIEVGIAFVATGRSRSWLIRPEPRWVQSGIWDPAAEQLHGITCERLTRYGVPVRVVARELAEAVAGLTVVSDFPPGDFFWLQLLYEHTEQKPPIWLERALPALEKTTGPLALNAQTLRHANRLALKRFPQTHRAGPDARRLAEFIRVLADRLPVTRGR